MQRRQRQMKARRQGRRGRAGGKLHARTAADVAVNLRRLIARHAAQLTQRLNRNHHGIPAADILAALGVDADALTGYLAAATNLGRIEPPVAPEPAPETPIAEAPAQ